MIRNYDIFFYLNILTSVKVCQSPKHFNSKWFNLVFYLQILTNLKDWKWRNWHLRSTFILYFRFVLKFVKPYRTDIKTLICSNKMYLHKLVFLHMSWDYRWTWEIDWLKTLLVHGYIVLKNLKEMHGFRDTVSVHNHAGLLLRYPNISSNFSFSSKWYKEGYYSM